MLTATHVTRDKSLPMTLFFDAIRTIDDVIEHRMNRDILGILVAIDFEKAFDSLNFNFLLRVLHTFNFGPSFIQQSGISLNLRTGPTGHGTLFNE